MIERLEGTLVQKAPALVHVQAGPIQIEILIPLSTFQGLPEPGAAVRLWTHLQWKEDGPTLYGFLSRSERELFRLLILVQGVGPRIALSLLSHSSPGELVREIRKRSVEGLTRVPGIGPKTAGRILVELGSKIDRMQLEHTAGEPEEAEPVSSPDGDDAVQALTALGYPARDARKAVDRILHDEPGVPLDECIRRALRQVTASTSNR